MHRIPVGNWKHTILIRLLTIALRSQPPVKKLLRKALPMRPISPKSCSNSTMEMSVFGRRSAGILHCCGLAQAAVRAAEQVTSAICSPFTLHLTNDRTHRSRNYAVLLDRQPDKGAIRPKQLLVLTRVVHVDADGSPRAYHPEDLAGKSVSHFELKDSGYVARGVCALDQFASGGINLFAGALKLAGSEYEGRRSYYATYDLTLSKFRFAAHKARARTGMSRPSPIRIVPRLRAAALLLQGGSDDETSLARTRAMKAALESANKIYRLRIFPGAFHTFEREPKFHPPGMRTAVPDENGLRSGPEKRRGM